MIAKSKFKKSNSHANPAIFRRSSLYRSKEEQFYIPHSATRSCSVGNNGDGMRIAGHRSRGERIEDEEMNKVLQSGSKLIVKSQLLFSI